MPTSPSHAPGTVADAEPAADDSLLAHVAALRAEVAALRDRADVAALCDRYVGYLDHGRDRDDWFGAVFTEDARLTFPFGAYEGFAGLAAFQSMARTTFERTHHIGGTNEIVVDGDRARVRGVVLAVHLRRGDEPDSHFQIGGHFRAEAVRTPAGWRLSGFFFDLVWRAGEPPRPKDTAATG
ncbi:nuclear transport factor 2 family protein [Streptomyces sp. DSM 44915]|uniref:Nuclear transport factor 2 family protein n=1 Tax=Streptomyces chisholmiae TaxID=3075540 RepID=A0ABU2JPI8_9ACTN|nr:nuclear transport factor 2 family protein [Streptomyces sp. DSM 44915]MDT0266123.1 nuclear transport factor 2 family protein [Streptomyces sp. DSM 44915]